MNLTLIHPCIGHRAGQSYIRTWQMEPLPAAAIAGLTPKGMETYTAKSRRVLPVKTTRKSPAVTLQ